MKKYVFLSLLALSVPVVSQAAWWNPTTWFQSSNNQVTSQQAQQSSTTATAEVSTVKSQNQTITTSVQSIRQSTNDESELISKINTLTTQNISLQSKISNIESQLNSAQSSYSICQTNLVSVLNTHAQSGVNDIQSQVVAPIVNPASVTFSANDPSTPQVSAKSISVTTMGNGKYLGLSVLTLYLIPSSNDIYLHTLTVNLNTSGQGTVNAAYLYQGNIESGSKPIVTGIVANGAVTFTINPTSPLQVQLYKNTASSGNNPNNLLTIKIDVSGLANSGDSEVISASAINLTANTSTGQGVNISGAASGNIITVQQP